MNKTVIIYSTPSCHYCNLAKDFFSANHIEYVEYNVAADTKKRAEMVEMTGQMGVPVIQIDESVLVGFNQSAMEQLLFPSGIKTEQPGVVVGRDEEESKGIFQSVKDFFSK